MKLVKTVVCVALLVSFALVGLSTTAVAQTVLSSPAEEAGLLYMWEEEKLARDVYTEMYDKWGNRIFSNIMASEQTHMDAILTLLDRYGLDAPVDNDAYGKFDNDYIEGLYITLVAQGLQSLEDALKVGVIIEETDIEDLGEFLETAAFKRDIKRVYTNLLAGSHNHLDAFNAQLEP